MQNKIMSLTTLDASDYEKIDLDRLVIFSIIKIESLGLDLSLENIIVAAFRLFPKRFSLIGYPEYPDATRVEKCLWRCKGKTRQWIGGKTPHGYQINEKTRLIATQVEKQLTHEQVFSKQKNKTRLRRKESIIKDIKESPAYQKYIKRNEDLITESDMCYLLQGTLDTPSYILQKNLVLMKTFTEELDEKELLGFLMKMEIKTLYVLKR